MKKLKEVTDLIQRDFKYDPNLIFVDTFERIAANLKIISDLVIELNKSDANYWIIYNIVISMLPICEKIIFCGYSDQILEFLLTINREVSVNLILITSRFVPLRVQLFSVICSAFANTDESRDKDADTFISTFKTEMLQYKQLEETNISGLYEKITVCSGETITLNDLYANAFNVIELINVHFTGADDISLENPLSSRKQEKKPKGKTPKKDDAPPQTASLPSEHVVQLISNTFSAKGNKADYASKYAGIAASWTNPECNFTANLLHRLLFSLMKCGTNVESIEQLKEVLPEDPIVKITAAFQEKNWVSIGDILASLTNEQIAEDFVFFNQLASTIWAKFSKGQLEETMPLKGALRVFVASPSPCPMQTSLVALKLAWYLDSQNKHEEAAKVAEDALEVVENFRDIFAIRKSEKILASSKIPSMPLDPNYLLFEKWLICMHTDILTILFKSKLSYGLECDEHKAKEDFATQMEDLKKEKEKTKELYGTLSQKQKKQFDESLSKQFKPPNHSDAVESELLERCKSNNMAKAILYIQMAFFRPSKAGPLLEKAREMLTTESERELSIASPVIYVNRTEAAFIYCGNQQECKQIALFGKESINSSGLTLSNTALQGTGIKQDKIDPFIVTGLKPNTLYSFGFAAYDAHGEVIDTITDTFTVTTTHPLFIELIWCYIASAAYQLKDMISFDASLSTLLQTYANVSDDPAEAKFYKNINPFNRFNLKEFTLNEPAPLLQAFSTALIMAARLFASKPLHATAFHKLALEVSQVLGNANLTLQICNEMFTILQPILINEFHAKWVIHPLLCIVTALKTNKETQKNPLHQNIISRASFALDSAFVSLYQEKQLSVFVMNSILELPPNPMRTSFLMFASRYHLLESNTGDSTLPLAAADLFRSSPEKSHDDLFSKFKADANYLCAATYLVANAHTEGLINQGSAWATAALEYAKSQLSDEDKNSKLRGGKAKDAAKAAKPKKPPQKKDKKDANQGSTDDLASSTAAVKIQSAALKYITRVKNLKRFADANKFRCALNMIQAMCLIESESPTITTAVPTERQKAKRKQAHSKKDKSGGEDDQQQQVDNSTHILTLLRRAIVLASRVNDQTVIRSSVNLLRDYLHSLQPGCSILAGENPLLDVTTHVLIEVLPLSEKYAQLLFQDLLLALSVNKVTKNLVQHMIDATAVEPRCGLYLWILNGIEFPEELLEIQERIQRRDPAENLFYTALDTLNKERYLASTPSFESMIKGVSDIAINLQHKQRLSMSCTLLRRVAFMLFEHNEKEEATQKLLEALECHFRTIRVYEKVDQIIAEDSEEKFYQKHSWSGCISIFAISSLVAMNSERPRAMMLSKLASYALAALFAGNALNPTKAIDYATYEPSEIISGIDIFSQFDPAQPLLEPVPSEYLTLAISYHLSSLLSYEMHFEMFKPLAFAKHYYRFIVRDPRLLTRARLFTVQVCAHFGLMKFAFDVMSNIVTSFGFTRRTKEYQAAPQQAKRLEFNEREPAYSQSNSECIKQMTSQNVLTSVLAQYGLPLASQYVIAASKILQGLYETNDPEGCATNTSNAAAAASSTTKAHKKSHHSKKEAQATESKESLPVVQAIDIFDQTVKVATQMVSDFIQKEFKGDQVLVKAELQLELAYLKAAQWSWEGAITTAYEVIECVGSTIKTEMFIPDQLSNRPLLLPCGITSLASALIGRAAYNIHDLVVADRYGSPYIKTLCSIHKADIESAAILLAQIAAQKPVTAYYKEYVLSCGQLATLYCFNHKLVDICAAKVHHSLRAKIQPLALISQLKTDVLNFFTEQLGLKQTDNKYIRGTHLIIRLMHLDALIQSHFGKASDAVVIIQSAIEMMRTKCPYVSHGLMYLLCVTSAAIQVKAFIASHPTCIQFWNQDINPLQIDPSQKFAPEQVNSLKELLLNIFKNNPDCVVHPLSNQASLDLVVLSGLIQEDDKRTEESFTALKMATATRSSSRFIQSIVATQPDTPPTSAPLKIINDNKDASMRGIAAAYYAHIIELALPIFDSSLLEERTLYFFKCFEDQCASFKWQTHVDSPPEQGEVSCQWYMIDARSVKQNETTNEAAPTATVHSMKSSVSMSTSVTRTTTTHSSSITASARKKLANLLRGNVLFCIGISCETEENKKKRGDVTSKGLTPFMLAGQPNELKSLSDELSGIGLEVEEVKRSCTIDNTPVEQPKETNDKKAKKSNNKPVKVEQPTVVKGQVSPQMKEAESKWVMAIHKTQAALTKSARLLSTISPKGSTFTTELRATKLDISTASSFSRLFNQQYGLCEKAPILADWFANEIVKASIPASVAAVSTAPSANSETTQQTN